MTGGWSEGIGGSTIVSPANKLISPRVHAEVEGAVRSGAHRCFEGHVRRIAMGVVPKLLLFPHRHAHAPAGTSMRQLMMRASKSLAHLAYSS